MGMDRYYDAQEARQSKRHDETCAYRRAIEIFLRWPREVMGMDKYHPSLGVLFLEAVLKRVSYMDRGGTVRYPADSLVTRIEKLIDTKEGADRIKAELERE